MAIRLSKSGKIRLRSGLLGLTRSLMVAGTGVALTDVADQHVFQRVGSSKTITVAGSYTGSPSKIQARVVDLNGAEVVGWTTVATNPSGGAFSGPLAVPQGGWYRLQVRDGVNTALTANGANRFGVGMVVALIGQSNMVNLGASALHYPLGDTKLVGFQSSAWRRIGNINDAYAPGTEFVAGGYSTYTRDASSLYGDGIVHLGNQLRAAMGIPIGLLPYAVIGSSIEQWQAGGSCWTPFISAANAAGGDFEAAIWLQGENNTGTPMATYKANLGNLLANLRAQTGRSASQFQFGVVGLGPGVSYFGAEGNGGLVRAAQQEFVSANSANGVYYSGSAHDADLAGGDVHFNSASQAVMGKRYARGLLARFGLATVGAQGPRITGATRSGATITVAVQQSGGTGLSDGAGGNGSALLGFRVFDGGVPATISSTAIAGNTVVLTLAATPTGIVTLDYAMTNAPYGSTTAPASVVYDNDVVFGSANGLPLQPCAAIGVI